MTHRRLADQATELHLADEARSRRLLDVVLTHVAVEPVGKVDELVVQGEEYVADERRHGHWPAGHVLGRLHLNDLLDEPLARLFALPPMPNGGAERGADETVAALRIVVEAHLEWHEALGAQVELFDYLGLAPVPQVDLLAVLAYII